MKRAHPTTNPQQVMRPGKYAIQADKQFPGIWKQIDLLRDELIKRIEWPGWCFLPANIQVREDIVAEDNADLTLLAAWRASQGIYRFDPAVFDSVWNTPINGDIPSEVLKHLPEWCVYIETPDRMIDIGGQPVRLYGFFVGMSFMVEEKLPENIMFMLDTGSESLIPYIFPTQLAPGVYASIDEMIALYMDEGGNAFYPKDPELWSSPYQKDVTKQLLADVLPHLFALTLYLCSMNAEFRDSRDGSDKRPQRPLPKKTKDGFRYFPPDRPTVWETAWRIGAAIRRHGNPSALHETNHTGEKKRPHIRRAHWHTFLAGPRDGQRDVRIKWLPPIPVNVASPDDLIPAVRAVD